MSGERRTEPELDAFDFMRLIRETIKIMQMPEEFLQRSVNEGFSGGEKKRNEVLQMLVLKPTLAVLAESDPFLEEAARTMGAGRLQRLFHVVVPQCVPGLAAGAFFAFNISFDEAVLSLFLRKPGLTTLPVQIYGQLEFSPDPSVAAVSSIMVALTVVLILIIDRFLGIKKFASA